jgi:hypothetical protein
MKRQEGCRVGYFSLSIAMIERVKSRCYAMDRLHSNTPDEKESKTPKSDIDIKERERKKRNENTKQIFWTAEIILVGSCFEKHDGKKGNGRKEGGKGVGSIMMQVIR